MASRLKIVALRVSSIAVLILIWWVASELVNDAQIPAGAMGDRHDYRCGF